MARAATKRNQGTRQAPGAVAPDQKRARKKAEKSLEDELFFNRLRGHAKWVFVLLAIVFGFSFVFLGVGTGAGGLSDVFNSLVGHSSGTSIESLQQKVAENPKSRAAVIDLASALQRDGRTDEAIAAYQTYLGEKPKDASRAREPRDPLPDGRRRGGERRQHGAPRAEPRRPRGAVPARIRSPRRRSRLVRRPDRPGRLDSGRAGVPGRNRPLPGGEQAGARRAQEARQALPERLVGPPPLRTGG